MSAKNYPAFDTLELNTELEFSFTRYEKLSPVQAGELVAALGAVHNRGKWHSYFDENNFDFAAQSFTYTRKPLLLYFYEQDWGEVAAQHLRQLSAIKSELRALYTNILVVTSQPSQALQQQLWQDGLSLEVYQDDQRELARLFRIYSNRSPAWSRYAGIEQNIPLPALYLLDHHRQVVVDHPNEELLEKLPLDVVKAVVGRSEQYWQERKSA